MIFQQTAAPTGWTKQTVLNDCGLRVTSGSVTTTGGTAFSTVFAQNATGNYTLQVADMPSHTHTHNANQEPTTGILTGASGVNVGTVPLAGLATINATGGGGPHSHPISLSLAYTDVIIAQKN